MTALTQPSPGVPLERRQLTVRGLVQGVGFRPHVYRTAVRHGVRGYVRNTGDGVEILAEGVGLENFVTALCMELPALARIDQLESRPLRQMDVSAHFEIRDTAAADIAEAELPPDLDLCDDCLAELFDPHNRRHLYPFIACSECGPRLSMTRRLPYDRANTAMADFPLCGPCRAEYEAPASRRFHAEPVACGDCGPELTHPVGAVADVLRAGGIVGLKTVGGFHLLCDAHNAAAVSRLRKRKRRDAKPLAVLVTNAACAEQYVAVDAGGRRALESRARPVVVMDRRRGGCCLPDELAPGLATLGLALPANAIQYLLLHALLDAPAGTDWLAQPNDVALVMTSANVSGEPLIACGAEAASELDGIADLIVDHDREVAQRVDDSVVRASGSEAYLVRRARGYAPAPITLSDAGPCVIATGAHLKNTVAIARGGEAILSQHLGDLDVPAAIDAQARTLDLLRGLIKDQPAALACDWHRDYASTRLAETLAEDLNVPLIRVQHHHAHVAAVLAEHRHEGPALGVALDGHGLGERDEAWGGELLRVDGACFERLGHLQTLRAPGGDVAAREPWRLAFAWLHDRCGRDAALERFGDLPLADGLAGMLDANVDAVGKTTSAGRLFDTAAALLGVATHAAFEGDPAMRLEGLARIPVALPGGHRLRAGVLDFTPLLERLCESIDPAEGASMFHGTLVEGLACWISEAASNTGLDTVALSGGCFLNTHLRRYLPERLRAAGLNVLVPELVPANDGGISLGQAWVARSALQTSSKRGG